jgi:MFS family permease
MNRRLLAHVPRMLMGYAAAGLVAAIMLGVTDFIQNPDKLNEPFKHLKGIGTVTFAMLAMAFPVWLFCVIACEYNNARQLRWYVLAGSLAALIPLLLFGLLFEMLAHVPWLLPFLVMIGVAGGATYWAIAGRKAGAWKSEI